MKILNTNGKGGKEEQLKTKLLTYPDSYYRERDAELRLKLLELAEETLGQTKEDRIRRELWELRYVKRDGRYIDRFLAAWMELSYLSENGKGLFMVRNGAKLAATLDDIGFARLMEEDELFRNLLYKEIYHLGMLYMELCTEDPGYSALILGFGKMSDASLKRKISEDVLKVSEKLFRIYHPDEKYEIWKMALLDALNDAL